MPESEYRLLIHEPGPNSDPVPMIVTHKKVAPRALPKSFGRHLWEIGLGLLPTLFLGASLGVWMASHRPPTSYAAALSATPDREMRPQLIEALEEQTAAIVNQPQEQRNSGWSVEFSQMQLNSWLADRFPHVEGEWTELGIRDPRILIAPRSIDVGFRVERPGDDEFWSLSLLPRVTGPHQFVCQILGVKLGLLPIPLDRIELQSKGVMQGEDWELGWSYNRSNHSITIDLPEDSGIPPLSELEILPETIRFRGDQSANPSETSAALPTDNTQENTPANPEALTPTPPGK